MTAFVLKLIALTAMLIDHLGAVFPDYFPFEFRIIGRLAFPLYVFLIAEGCRHSRNMPKFLFRLFVFALISEVPFDYAVNNGNIDFIQDTNIFYTLFLGTVTVYMYQALQKKYPALALYLSVLPLLCAMWLANWLTTDYSAFGVAFIFTMYVISHKRLRLCAMLVFCCFNYIDVLLGLINMGLSLVPYINSPPFSSYGFYLNAKSIGLLIFCLLAVPLAALYNGKRGLSMKWFFYISYPAHLTVYVIAYRLIGM